MITISELFPTWRTAFRWLETFRPISKEEVVRLVKEYTESDIVCNDYDVTFYLLTNTVHEYYSNKTIEYNLKGQKLHKTVFNEFHDVVKRVSYVPYTTKRWYYHGILHSNDCPAVKTYYPSGELRLEEWMAYGKWHREGNPAVIKYDKNGEIIHTIWYRHGNPCAIPENQITE